MIKQSSAMQRRDYLVLVQDTKAAQQVIVCPIRNMSTSDFSQIKRRCFRGTMLATPVPKTQFGSMLLDYSLCRHC